MSDGMIVNPCSAAPGCTRIGEMHPGVKKKKNNNFSICLMERILICL